MDEAFETRRIVATREDAAALSPLAFGVRDDEGANGRRFELDRGVTMLVVADGCGLVGVNAEEEGCTGGDGLRRFVEDNVENGERAERKDDVAATAVNAEDGIDGFGKKSVGEKKSAELDDGDELMEDAADDERT